MCIFHEINILEKEGRGEGWREEERQRDGDGFRPSEQMKPTDQKKASGIFEKKFSNRMHYGRYALTVTVQMPLEKTL